jgi:signal transduction histidine kinase
VSGSRWVFSRIALPRQDRIASPVRLMRWYSLLTLLNGAAWGVAALLYMVPGDPLVFTMCLMGLAGIASGAVGSLSPYPPAYWTFATACLGLVVVAFLRATSFGWPAAFMAAIYFGANISFLRVVHSSLVEAIRLRLENEALLVEVTEEKDRALRAQQTAERATHAKSKFLAAASHDLRQPVHALALFSSALGERADREAEVRRIAGLVETATLSMKSLLDGLLDISKLDAGSVEPVIRDVPLQSIIDPVCAELEPDARSKGLTMKVDRVDTWVRTDPAMLERILRNLVGNAIRYTESGEIRVQCTGDDELLELSVRDTGPGIPGDMHDEIFIEFRQVHNPERDRSKGLGLGLAIVRRLAALLDHPLSLRSEIGAGSTFSLSLPVVEARTAVRADQPQTTADLEGRTVLVIDDESAVLEALRTILEAWGCSVLTASSGSEAADVVTGTAVDVVVADYRLRDEETGIAAIDHVFTALGRSVPTLLVTGDTHPERIREAESAGYPLVHKPVLGSDLKQALRTALA